MQTTSGARVSNRQTSALNYGLYTDAHDDVLYAGDSFWEVWNVAMEVAQRDHDTFVVVKDHRVPLANAAMRDYPARPPRFIRPARFIKSAT